MNISKTEIEVMKVIWKIEPCTSLDIVKKLNQYGSWHEKTVKTLINRLLKKNVIRFDKLGRQYQYSAILSKEAFQQTQSTDFVSQIFNGNLGSLISAFTTENTLSHKDIEELKAVINKWEQNND